MQMSWIDNYSILINSFCLMRTVLNVHFFLRVHDLVETLSSNFPFSETAFYKPTKLGSEKLLRVFNHAFLELLESLSSLETLELMNWSFQSPPKIGVFGILVRIFCLEYWDVFMVLSRIFWSFLTRILKVIFQFWKTSNRLKYSAGPATIPLGPIL